MRFADAHAAQEHDVGFVGDELQPKEVLDLQAVDLFGMIPLELFEGLEDQNAGLAEAALDAALALLVMFALGQTAEIFQMIPMFGGRLGGQRGMLVLDELEFEGF